MVLRRITEHVKTQNWFAVGLDFVIVVVGVFIGIQVSNWNEARGDQRAYRDAMTRLAEESAETLQSAAEQRAVINKMLSDVQPAIDALRACETGAAAEATVNKGLNTIRSSRGAGAVTIAVDQLVDDERLLNQQSDAQRVALRQYYSSLHDINNVSEFLNDIAGAGDDSHPLIGFTGVLDPIKTFNGVDIRRAQLNVPLDKACKDQSFLKLFYNWERSHVFQLKLIRDLEATVTENVRSLNLSDFNAELAERTK
jgi:hypothetical protein